MASPRPAWSRDRFCAVVAATFRGNRPFPVAVSVRALFGLGDAAAIVAILWVATQQDGNPGLVTGLATVALTLPTVALAPTLGPLLDRASRVRIMRRAASLRSVVLAGMVVAVSSEALPALLLLTAAHAGLGALAGAAYSAGLPEIVRDEHLSRANGVTQAALNISLGIGAGGGGFALAQVGAPATFGALAVLAAVAAGVSLLLGPAALDHEGARERGTWARDLREGLRAVAAVRQLRLLLGLGALSVLGFAPALVALVALIDQRLGAGPDALGVLQTLTTVGLAVGAAFAHRAGRRWGSATAMGCALVVMGVATTVLGTATSVLAAAILVAVRGLSNSVSSVHNATLLQRNAPAPVRGRVLSTAMSVIELPRLAAPVIGGALVDTVGVTALYAGMGVMITAAGLGALVLRTALEPRVASEGVSEATAPRRARRSPS